MMAIEQFGGEPENFQIVEELKKEREKILKLMEASGETLELQKRLAEIERQIEELKRSY